jgi:hypothetical protein
MNAAKGGECYGKDVAEIVGGLFAAMNAAKGGECYCQ